MLAIGVQLYRADASPGGRAWSSEPDDVDGYDYVTPNMCGVGGADQRAWLDLERAGIAWHVSGRIVDRFRDLFVITVEWERIWEAGRPIENVQKTTSQFAVRLGERVMLDQVFPDAPSQCAAEARLEAAVEMHPVLPKPSAGARGSGYGGTRVAGAAGSGGGGGGGGRAEAGVAQVSAQLWLIHTFPDGREESQMLSMTAGKDSPNYAFNPIVISTASGPVNVDVNGFLRARPPDRASTLLVFIDRRLTSARIPDLTSSGIKMVPLPGTGEVISFELPSSSREQDLLSNHRFEIRLRVHGAR
jgi:hypothetical protein